MTESRDYDVDRFKSLNEEEWTDPVIVAGWRKWHDHFCQFTKPITEEMIRLGDIQPGQEVLDLASGSGEPALSLAEIVAPNGRVTATDLGPGMLAVAKENAQTAGATNVRFEEVDVHSLLFPDHSFDRVTCRNGVMYFADYRQALREAARVLKPGGRIVLAAVGPFDQPLFTTTLGVLMNHVEVPPPDPDAPDPFRFAGEGTLSGALRDAGLENVKEEHRSLMLPWPGSPEDLWQWFRDVSPLFAPLLDKLTREQRNQVDSEVASAIGEYADENCVKMPWLSVFAAGGR